MAKIKLAGYNDLIKVDNKIATEVRAQWNDNNVPKDTIFNIGSVSIRKGEVKAIFLDEDIAQLGQKFKGQLQEYYKWRDHILTLPPRERAEKCTAWGMFGLFFRGVYNKQPEEIVWKEKVLQATTEFFELNPQWAKPSFEVFQKMLKLEDKDAINAQIMTMISRMHQSELQDIEQTKLYEAGKTTREAIVQSVAGDEINIEALFQDELKD